jgi:hypothetical protein
MLSAFWSCARAERYRDAMGMTASQNAAPSLQIENGVR